MATALLPCGGSGLVAPREDTRDARGGMEQYVGVGQAQLDSERDSF